MVQVIFRSDRFGSGTGNTRPHFPPLARYLVRDMKRCSRHRPQRSFAAFAKATSTVDVEVRRSEVARQLTEDFHRGVPRRQPAPGWDAVLLGRPRGCDGPRSGCDWPRSGRPSTSGRARRTCWYRQRWPVPGRADPELPGEGHLLLVEHIERTWLSVPRVIDVCSITFRAKQDKVTVVWFGAGTGVVP